MDISSITGRVETPSYIEQVNKRNKEDQDRRNVENLVNSREWQSQLQDIKKMEIDYEALQRYQTIVASEANLLNNGTNYGAIMADESDVLSYLGVDTVA